MGSFQLFLLIIGNVVLALGLYFVVDNYRVREIKEPFHFVYSGNKMWIIGTFFTLMSTFYPVNWIPLLFLCGAYFLVGFLLYTSRPHLKYSTDEVTRLSNAERTFRENARYTEGFGVGMMVGSFAVAMVLIMLLVFGGSV